MPNQEAHVVVIGAGFGGLRAARALAKAPVHVTLINRRNYHLFQPLLYQVATAGISEDQIAHPVRSILRDQKNLDFFMTKVDRVDFTNRRLVTSTCTYDYDYLILAVGGTTNYFGLEGVMQHGFGLKDIDDAVAIRNHLLLQFEKAIQEVDPAVRRALLTFVVVGGGPTGVECSGAISELIRLVLSKDYPRLRMDDIRVILMEATQNLLPGMPDRLRQYTLRTLQKKHVEVRFQSAVDGYDGEVIQLKGGESLPTRTLIWAAGVRAAELVDTIDVEHGKLGRMVVEQTLQIPGHPEVFAIGDAAYLEDENGRPLPMVAPVAMQQADIAVENIRRSLAGQPLREFEYHDPGSLATIGRSAAVANLGRWQFTGFTAWVVWLVVHIMQLIGFRNRLFVLISWVWDYIFYDRAVRLIEPFKKFRTTPEEAQPVADDNQIE